MTNNHITCKSIECCGCGSCATLCPVQAILIEEDANGFLMPIVDENKCVSCGKCNKGCPFINARTVQHEAPKTVYAAVLKNKNELKKSSSGGVFAGTAAVFLKDYGMVYGASWNDDFSISHIGISSISGLNKLLGSKYSQSRIDTVLKEVRAQLDSGRRVLFSGTPCQVASLKCYLGKDYQELYCIDLVCHGVGSNRMLLDDIRYLENRYKCGISSISFRSKSRGWGTSGEIVFSNGKRHSYNTIISPYYYYYYLDDAIFRESCYHCPFSCENRTGDITIGDYWRIETAHPEINADLNQGISCILINTEKGQRLFEEVNNEFDYWSSDLEKVVNRNANVNSPSKEPQKRIQILNLYKQQGYDGLITYWKRNERIARLKLRIKHAIPSSFKHLIKKKLG